MKYSIVGLGLTALLFTSVGACASGPQDGPPDGPPNGPPGGPDGGPPPARPQVFVSPYGELFVSQSGEPYPVAAWFAGADTDHDGRLTAAEFAADGLRWFGKLDLDGDGVVGPGEIAAYERSVETTFAGLGGGMGGGMGPGGPRGRGRGQGGGQGGAQGAPPSDGEPMNLDGGAVQDGPPMGGGMGQSGGGQRPRQQPYRGGTERLARAGLLSVPQPVRSADRNVDQKITAEEWAAAGERWFVLLDQDHDGVLTLETLPKTAMQTGPGEGGRPPRR